MFLINTLFNSRIFDYKNVELYEENLHDFEYMLYVLFIYNVM